MPRRIEGICLPGEGWREAKVAPRFLLRAPLDDGSVHRDRSPPRRILFRSNDLVARRVSIGLGPTMESLTEEGEFLGDETATGGIASAATTKARPVASFERRGP